MTCQRCQLDNPALANFCVRCGGALAPPPPTPAPRTQRGTGGGPPAGPRAPQYAAVAPPARKDPVLAGVLSFFIPGLGQIYNDDVKKGAVMLVAAFVLALPTLGLAWLCFMAWATVDAYQVAEGRGRRWS